jgi:hypothetical protein
LDEAGSERGNPLAALTQKIDFNAISGEEESKVEENSYW